MLKKKLMNKLLVNAIDSIRVGVEDYETKEPARELSAVRNLHAGLLLLAKWVLVCAVPKASEDDLIANAYEPMPDGSGGVKFEPKGTQTIGLQDIQRRFKAFEVKLTSKTKQRLKSLAMVRNAVEHRYPGAATAPLRQTVSEAFMVAAELFRLGNVDPVDVVGDAWNVMLEVNEVYQKELAACQKTFGDVEWKFAMPIGADPECPKCGSGLVEQIEPNNKLQDDARANVVPAGKRWRLEQ